MIFRLPILILSFLSIGTVFSQNIKPVIIVDTTITGFRYATNFGEMAVYTKNGMADITSDTQPSAFSVIVSQDMTVNQAKQEFVQLIEMSSLAGYQLRDRIEKDTIINDHKVYIISYRAMLEAENYENRVFNGIIEMKDAILVFASGDLDKGKYMGQFIKTFYSLAH